MRRVFMTRNFSRWARKTGLSKLAMLKAADEMEKGLIDADLGGGVIKKRVALPGKGKRGSTRTIVATNWRDRWFFIFGFAKKDRENISSRELEALKSVADDLVALGDPQIEAAKEKKVIEELIGDD